MKKIATLLMFILFVYSGNSQIKKLGKVSKSEFSTTDTDKEANAIVLFKDVSVKIDYIGNDFVQKRTIRKRILLLNDKAFDYATIKGLLYQKGGKTEKVSVKAYTLNLEGSKIVKTKLNRKDIFIKKMNKYWRKFSFTLPNIKAGSIIDIRYEISSPFITKIDDIYYQEMVPIHQFHASISFPDFLKYKYVASRFFPVKLEEDTREHSITEQSYSVTREGSQHINRQKYNIKINYNDLKLSNIPAFKKEPYLSSIDNYIGKLTFELLGYEHSDGIFENFSKTWEGVASTIYFDSKFGSQLSKKSFFKEDLETAIAGTTDEKQKIAKILALVKSKIKWNNFYAKYSERNIAYAYKNHTGNYADVNLTLTAMLKAAGFEADPVLISTVDNGISIFPTLDGYNAVISAVKVRDTTYLLDATDKYSYLDVLPTRDLNWTGRLIKKEGKSQEISLYPTSNSLVHKKLVVNMNNDAEFTGYFVEIFFNNYAMRYRHKYDGLNDEKLEKEIEEKYDNEIEIEKIRISHLNKLNKSLKISSKLSFDSQAEQVGNKIIFSPLLFLKQKENIFKSDKRNYPIFFSFPRLDIYETNIIIPAGYKIEKLPEKLTYEMPDNMGTYVYTSELKGNKIVTKVITSINYSLIPNTQYKAVKDFFNQIVLKEDEKIVLIKK